METEFPAISYERLRTDVASEKSVKCVKDEVQVRFWITGSAGKVNITILVLADGEGDGDDAVRRKKDGFILW